MSLGPPSCDRLEMPGQAQSRLHPSVIWQDVECGGYTADLSLWEKLAATAGGPVLDLGCGAGRVALHLARHGHEVLGIDSDPALIAAFAQRAIGMTQAEARIGDARQLPLDDRFALAIAPMQLLQLFDSAQERIGCMRGVAEHLDSGGLAAFAIADPESSPVASVPLVPDVREVDGWIYSSLPLHTSADGESIAVRRLRQIVSPEGSLSDEVNDVCLRRVSADLLEREGEAAGLRPVGRREIPATEDHVGSIVVLLEAVA